MIPKIAVNLRKNNGKITVNRRESLTLRDKTVIIPKLIEKTIGRK